MVYLIERILSDWLVANPVRKNQEENELDLNRRLINQIRRLRFFFHPSMREMLFAYIVVYSELDSDYSVEPNPMLELP